MAHRRWVLTWLVLACVAGSAAAQVGQTLAIASRTPHFMAAGSTSGEVVDASKFALLRRRVSLDLTEVTLDAAMQEIARQGGIEVSYSKALFKTRRTVSLHVRGITVAAALTELLLESRVDIAIGVGGQIALVPCRHPEVEDVVRLGGSIEGRIRSRVTGESIGGAEVRVVGTTLTTTANDSGWYALRDVPTGERRVTVRQIGYQSATLVVVVPDDRVVWLDFDLNAAATRLDELVTTVTGEQRRTEVGHVIGTIKADSLVEGGAIVRLADLLQARAPGLQSFTWSNKVGAGGFVRIRGPNSFNLSNDPIFVIDGVRVEASYGGNPSFNGGGGYSGRISDFDPDEIESVEVVKGPSAATLYGTDAANGVIVVTTKRGRGGRTRWDASTAQGLIEQRIDQRVDAYYAFGHDISSGAVQRCTLPSQSAGVCVLDSLKSFDVFSDPDTRPFKTGRYEQYNLQVSGGLAAEAATYFLSGNYESEEGTYHLPRGDQELMMVARGVASLPDWQMRPNAASRVNARANLTFPIMRGGAVAVSAAFISNEMRLPLSTPRFQVGYRDANDGWLLPSSRPAGVFVNVANDEVRRFVSSVGLTHRVRDWLSVRGTIGADFSSDSYGNLQRLGDAIPGVSDIGSRGVTESAITRYSFDIGATATRVLSSTVNSKTSVGAQYNRRTQRGLTAGASGLPLAGETLAGASGGYGAAELTSTTAVAGAYVEEEVAYRDRLFLTGAIRLDGGSAFGEGFSVASYPKAGLSWIVTDDRGGPRIPLVSSLRLRAAFGSSGVQPPPTASLQLVTLGTGISGSQTVTTAALGSPGNPDLKPERTTEFEGGADLEFANGRVRAELTIYERKTRDALINRRLDPGVGGAMRWENIGSVRNRGFEIMLSADVLQSATWSAGMTLTGSVNKNRLLELGEGVTESSDLTEGTRQVPGYPLYGWWGRDVESFTDANSDGIITADEITLTANRFLGSNTPTREATASPYLRLFKNRLQLNGVFQYRGGFVVPDLSGLFNCFVSQSCREINDPTTPLATQARAQASFPLFAFGGFTDSGSFLLLRELSAGFTLPVGLNRSLGVREARISLAARNVAMLWREGTVVSPEGAGDFGDRNAPTEPAGPSTYWILRVNLNF